MEYGPKQFTGTGTQLTVIDFIDQVENFACMGRGYGPTKFDRLIDVVIRFVFTEIYK
jgi:hypothetical protein